MSSKIFQILMKSMNSKITTLFKNNFYLDVDNEDDRITFNHHITNYMIFEKYTKNSYTPYYFTLEKLCNDLYLCVWFKDNYNLQQIPAYKHFKYTISVSKLIEAIDDAKHLEDCENKDDGRCDCNEFYNACNEYSQIRQNYSLQYYRKLNKNDIALNSSKLQNEDIYEFYFEDFMNFIINFKFDNCINCSKITDELNENLCDDCLLKIDENHKEYPDECPICYDNECLKFKIKTPCNHLFHKECLKNNRETRLKTHSKNEDECPYCRKNLGYTYFHTL
jgi:hypothetical protein